MESKLIKPKPVSDMVQLTMTKREAQLLMAAVGGVTTEGGYSNEFAKMFLGLYNAVADLGISYNLINPWKTGTLLPQIRVGAEDDIPSPRA